MKYYLVLKFIQALNLKYFIIIGIIEIFLFVIEIISIFENLFLGKYFILYSYHFAFDLSFKYSDIMLLIPHIYFMGIYTIIIMAKNYVTNYNLLSFDRNLLYFNIILQNYMIVFN